MTTGTLVGKSQKGRDQGHACCCAHKQPCRAVKHGWLCVQQGTVQHSVRGCNCAAPHAPWPDSSYRSLASRGRAGTAGQLKQQLTLLSSVPVWYTAKLASMVQAHPGTPGSAQTSVRHSTSTAQQSRQLPTTYCCAAHRHTQGVCCPHSRPSHLLHAPEMNR